MFEAGEPCGTEANMAKLVASEASWFSADMCLQTHGGFGFAEEYDIERKFRETRLYQVAPISTNLISATWPPTCWANRRASDAPASQGFNRGKRGMTRKVCWTPSAPFRVFRGYQM